MNPAALPPLLTKLLQVFTFNFVGAAGRLQTEAQWLLVVFFGIEILWAGIWVVLRREWDFVQVVTLTLTAVILGWLITNWPALTQVLMKSFLSAGLIAGGDALKQTDLTNPDQILVYGFSATQVVFQAISDSSSWSLKVQTMNLLAGLVAVLALLFYIGMAIVVFYSLLEFYGNLAVTVFLLPFGMVPLTRFLCEKAVACIFAACIRIFLIAFLLSSALPIMVTATWATPDALAVACYTLVGALALVGLAWRLNSWAQSMLQGSVVFGLHDAATTAHTVTRQLEHLSEALQTLTDVLARTDPEHPRRQSPRARRPV